jgi:hypothetical protein
MCSDAAIPATEYATAGPFISVANVALSEPHDPRTEDGEKAAPRQRTFEHLGLADPGSMWISLYIDDEFADAARHFHVSA